MIRLSNKELHKISIPQIVTDYTAYHYDSDDYINYLLSRGLIWKEFAERIIEAEKLKTMKATIDSLQIQ